MMRSGAENPGVILEPRRCGNPDVDKSLYTLYGFVIPAYDERWQQVTSTRSTLQVLQGGGVAAAIETAPLPAGLPDRAALAARLQAHQAALEAFRQAAIPIVPVTLSAPPFTLSRIQRVLATHGQRLHIAITCLEGLIELDIQATWPYLPAVLKRIAAADPDIRAVLNNESRPVSPEVQIRVGALLARAIEQQRAAITKQWVRALSPAVTALRTDLPAASDMVVNLAVLLRGDQEENILSIVMELSRAADDGLHIRTIGPLVPVSFSAVQVVPLSPARIEEDCRILAISETLVAEAMVNTAYRRRAHQLHPDRAEEPDDRAFQQVVAAARRLRTLAVQAGGVFRRDREAEILEFPAREVVQT